MNTLKNITISFLFLLVAWSFFIPNAISGSLLSGITVLDGKEGVTVYEIKPDTPAQNSGIRKNDVIVAIEGVQIKTMNDYVKNSIKLKNKKIELKIVIKRKKKVFSLSIANYSKPIKEYWDEKAPYSMEKVPKNKDAYSYWVKKAKLKLNSIKIDMSSAQKIMSYRNTINYLYSALHYKPKKVKAMIMVADIYKKIGEIFIKENAFDKAKENFLVGMSLYKKSIVKSNLSKDELTKILNNLKAIESLLNQIYETN